LINHGKSTKRFEKGSRVAQLILERAAKMRVIEVDELDETERGEQGFGQMDK
jgi:dUTP pyrophosphatase